MTDHWKQAFLAESAVSTFVSVQAQTGVMVDKVKAAFSIHVLNERILRLDSVSVPQMPKMLERGCTATAPYKKDGNLKSNVEKWLKVENLEEMKISGPFCGVSWRDFDMGKTERVKEYLVILGWVPDTWKFKDITMHSSIKRPLNKEEQEAALENYMAELKKTNLGKLRMKMLGLKPGAMTKRQVKEFLLKKRKVPAGAKLTEESLDKFEGGDIGMILKQRLTLAHRRSLLQGIISLIRDDGRIEAQAITIGTPTMRMRHKGVVNIPKAAKHVLFGAQCRIIFCSGHCDLKDNPRGLILMDGEHKKWIPKGRRVFVGYDGAGLELRMLAHFINDEEYTRQILDGDIHTYNQNLAGLPNRDAAKTFNTMGVYKLI